MIKLIEFYNGEKYLINVFETFQDLKQHLLEKDYFSWINENEPEKELPNFESVESLNEIKQIFKDYDYDWWTLMISHPTNHTTK